MRDNVNPAGPRTTVETVAGLHGVSVVRHGGETQEEFAVCRAAKQDGLNPKITLWVRRVRARIELIAVIHAVAVTVDAKALAGALGDESERDFTAGARQANQPLGRDPLVPAIRLKETRAPVVKPAPRRARLRAFRDEVQAAGRRGGQRQHR